MKIFIDFDDTLFDSVKFKKYFENVFIREGISANNFRKSYNRVKEKGIYSLEKHLEFLGLDEGIKGKNVQKKLKNLFSDLSCCVYADSWEFVEKFPRKDLIILSFGQHSFQKKKMLGSKISKKFSKMIITQSRKIGTIHDFTKKNNCQGEKLVLIDNKAEFLEKVEKNDHEILTIQMLRNKSEKIAKHADYRVKKFKEVLKIINEQKFT